MKSQSIFDSEHFPVEIKNGISIIKIKIPRATFNEAEEFKEVLQSIIFTKHYKVIVDFSDCQYADSMIIGIMVNIVKSVRQKNGDILVITPSSSLKVMFARTGLFKIFKQFWTKDEAIESFSNT
ncbi:MAG: STAS domain-containing protein [Ignavibacterium sp.]|jgi:anti-anti-sigma factor|nr:STAS domain-containing protein [Ignavibacterium sp.]